MVEVITEDFKVLALNEVPVYSNPEVEKVISKISPFNYNKKTSSQLISKGPIKLENNAVYRGQWTSTHKRQGKGTQTWSDGAYYEGYWENDKINGRGRLINSNGELYEGD